MCVLEGERECVYVRGRERECVYVRGTEKERERELVSVCESVCVCVFVC